MNREVCKFFSGSFAALAYAHAAYAVATSSDIVDEPVFLVGHPDYPPSNPPTLTFTDSRTDATFTCRLDAAPARACTSPVTYQNLAEGSHTFRVRATSPTLRQSNEASLTWTVDVTRPAQPTVTSPSSPTSSATVTVRFSSASTDVDHYLCSLDGAAIGAVGGLAASGGTGGQNVNLPAETKINFKLAKSLTIER